MLHMFVFPDSNSEVTYRVFLKILSPCTILLFQIKVRHPYTATSHQKAIQPAIFVIYNDFFGGIFEVLWNVQLSKAFLR